MSSAIDVLYDGRVRDAGRAEVLAGYAITRRVGRGRHSVAYLAGRSADDGATLLLKAYPEEHLGAACRTMEAASSTDSEHLVRPIDIAVHDGVAYTVSPRVSGISLHEYVVSRPSLLPGQIVTICVPVLRAVRSLHAAGLAHGSVTASAVLISGRGKPHLTRLSGVCRLVELDAEERVAARTTDFQQCADLIRLLAGPHAVPDFVAEMLALPRSGRTVRGWLGECERSLFDWAVPTPLGADASTERDPLGDAPARPDAPSSPASSRARQRGAETPPGTEPEPGLKQVLVGRTEALRSSMSAVTSTILQHLRQKKRLVWFGAGVCVGLVALVCALLPPDDVTQAADKPEPTAAQDDSQRSTEEAEETSGDTASSTAEPGDDSDEGELSRVKTDDPVDAARQLLKNRRRCLSQESLSCLEDVEQSGSAALDEDRSRVAARRSGGNGDAPDFSDGSFTLVDRSGASALIAVDGEAKSPPISLLLIRGETGWLIRDIFDQSP